MKLRNRHLIVALTLAAIACGTEATKEDGTQSPQQYGEVVRSDKLRDLSPDVSTADLDTLVAGNRTFAIDLYHQLIQTNDNLFFSPQSVSQALAMTYAGARNDTETQMASVMSFELGQNDLHPAFNALDLALASRGDGAQGADGEGFRLHVANAIWGQTGYGFVAEFLDVLAESYDAGLRLLDFGKEPEASRQTINAWVSDQTEDKIPELLAPGTVLPETRLVLTNAIYFNAAWASVFPLELSSTNGFQLLDGSSVTVPTMTNGDVYPYAAGDGYQAVELPYDGDELSMLVIIPDLGRYAEIEASFDRLLIEEVESNMTPELLALTLPKWQFETKVKLRSQLLDLGMTNAFDGYAADFSGINGGTEALWIDDVIHQAFVAVDEYGTEAAAATAVIMAGGGMPIPVTTNRPFIFAIRDNPTGALLFVGRVLNPLD